METGGARYNALIIDSDLDARMRLRQATTAVTDFGEVHQVSTLNEGVSQMERFERCDVVFISETFPPEHTGHFIEKAKQEKRTQDAAFVQVLKTQKDGANDLARQMMQGFDGFLFEPYSVNQLVEITQLASVVKKERSETRSRAALSLMLSDIISQIDVVAMLKSLGCDVSRATKKLSDLGQSLRSMGSSCVNLYHDLAIKFFGEAHPPSELDAARRYRGVSDRVRKKMGDKLAQQLEQKQIESRIVRK